MKTIPMVPACHNMAELKKLTDLICECIHPELIILFGHYAGMQLTNIQSGYEMLIATKETPSITYRQLLHYLNQHDRTEARQEQSLAVYLFTTKFVRKMAPQSDFLTTILKDGILLYKSEGCTLSEYSKYKPTRIYQHTLLHTDRCLAMGRALLLDAHRNYENGVYRLAAFYLYQATVQFTRAVTYGQYGFIPEEEGDLFMAYARIRYCSEELKVLWSKTGDLNGWRMLARLMTFNQRALDDHFHLNSNGLSLCLEKLRLFEIAAGNYCLQRIQVLATLQNT